MKYGALMNNDWEEAGFIQLEYAEFKRLSSRNQAAKQSEITLARTSMAYDWLCRNFWKAESKSGEISIFCELGIPEMHL